MAIEEIKSLVQRDPNAVIEAIHKEPSICFDTFESDQRTLLHLAAGFGQLSLVKVLVDYGADVNAIDKYDETPLFRSIRFRKDEVSLYLLNHFSDFSLEHTDHKGQTVLHRACSMGTVSMVILLLERGANPLAVDVEGRTPLDVGRDSSFAANQYSLWKDELERQMAIAATKEQSRKGATQELNTQAESEALDLHLEAPPIIAYDGHHVINQDCLKLDDWLYTLGWVHRVNPPLAGAHVLPGTMIFWVRPKRVFLVYANSSTQIKYYHSHLREQAIFVGSTECQNPSASIAPLLKKLESI
jgi:hypothetical protein